MACVKIDTPRSNDSDKPVNTLGGRLLSSIINSRAAYRPAIVSESMKNVCGKRFPFQFACMREAECGESFSSDQTRHDVHERMAKVHTHSIQLSAKWDFLRCASQYELLVKTNLVLRINLDPWSSVHTLDALNMKFIRSKCGIMIVDCFKESNLHAYLSRTPFYIRITVSEPFVIHIQCRI